MRRRFLVLALPLLLTGCPAAVPFIPVMVAGASVAGAIVTGAVTVIVAVENAKNKTPSTTVTPAPGTQSGGR